MSTIYIDKEKPSPHPYYTSSSKMKFSFPKAKRFPKSNNDQLWFLIRKYSNYEIKDTNKLSIKFVKFGKSKRFDIKYPEIPSPQKYYPDKFTLLSTYKTASSYSMGMSRECDSKNLNNVYKIIDKSIPGVGQYFYESKVSASPSFSMRKKNLLSSNY